MRFVLEVYIYAFLACEIGYKYIIRIYDVYIRSAYLIVQTTMVRFPPRDIKKGNREDEKEKKGGRKGGQRIVCRIRWICQ